MEAIRHLRLEKVLIEELAHLVSRELKDPRVPPLTFTKLKISKDGSTAFVHFSLLGGTHTGYGSHLDLTEKEASNRLKNCLKGLTSAAPFLRKVLMKNLKLRHVPQLQFQEDRSLDDLIQVHRLFHELSAKTQA